MIEIRGTSDCMTSERKNPSIGGPGQITITITITCYPISLINNVHEISTVVGCNTERRCATKA
jgi:hypothetical protein